MNNWYVGRGEMEADVVDGFWGDAGESIEAYYEVNDFVRRRRHVNVRTFPLTLHEDERGWFAELIRASALPKPIKQANLSRSRKGVIRGLHYHERGQDDLFVCLEGMVRVVVLDRETRRGLHRGHRRRQSGRRLRARHARARLRGADRLPLHVPRHARSTTRRRPDEHGIPWDDERVRHVWSTSSPILSARDASS